jgi:2OG-Fe(II) oxygenase superfamily
LERCEGADADGESFHFLGQALLMDGRWVDAHAVWRSAAECAAAAASWLPLRLQAEKDASFWPAPGAPSERAATLPITPPAFETVPLGMGSHAALSVGERLFDADAAARAVRAAETAAAAGGGWSTQRHYAVPTTDLPLAGEGLRETLLPWFNDFLRDKLAPLLAAAYPELLPDGARQLRIHDAFLVRYSAEAQRALPTHADESQLSFTVALNQAPAFEGGGTFFERAQRTVRPAEGHAVAFPGEARHAGEATTAGARYILAVFCHVA